MKNNYTPIIYNTAIAVIILMAFMIVYTILPQDFASIPPHVARYESLFDPNVIDTVRYMYRGATLGVVYGILNNLNNKIYVGSTSDPVDRFYCHLISGINSNLYLQNSILKYGIQWFSLIIFKVTSYPLINGVFDKKAMFADEQVFLNVFPVNQKLNIATVAGGGGKPFTLAMRAATSMRMKGVNIGRPPINKGVPVTTAMKEVRRVASLHRSHPVYIYDDMFNLVTVYSSISDAVRIEKTQKNNFIQFMKTGKL